MNQCSNKIGINFELKFQEIKDVNPSFDAAKIAIAYADKNRNMSSISKDVFEAALPTIKNIPLVGRYIEDENDFGSHDIRVVIKDDSFDVQNATVPFGVVPESAAQWWEEVTEEDGTVREYLFTDCLLWKRQAGYECLKSQGHWHQSMEIDLNKYIIDADGYCVIEDFTFTALCILGNSVEPCFESASVQMASDAAVSVYKQQFALMLDDMKKEFCKENIDTKEDSALKLSAEARDRILAEFNINLEDVAFEITDEMDEYMFRAALTEMANDDPAESGDASSDNAEEPENAPEVHADETPAEEPEADPVDDADGESSEAPSDYALSYNQKREVLSQALPKPENGYVWLLDFDDVFVYYGQGKYVDDNYQENYFRSKYAFDANTAVISSEAEVVVNQWLTLEEKEKLDAEHALLEELKEFKQNYLTTEHRAQIDQAIEEFSDLNGIEEFEKLKETAYSFEDINDLKKECYAIKGMREYAKPENMNKKNVRVPISGAALPGNDSVGALFAQFSKK